MTLKHQIGGHDGVSSDESGTLVIKPTAPREIAFYQLLHSLPAPSKHSSIPAVSPAMYPTTATADDNTAGDSTRCTDTEGVLIRRELVLGHLKKFLPKFYGTLNVQNALPASSTAKQPPSPPTTQLDDVMDGEEPAKVENNPAESKPGKSLTECIVLQNLTTPFLHPCIMDIKLGTVLYDATDPSLTAAKRVKMEEKMRVRSSTKTGMAITGFQTWNAQEEKYMSLDRETCGKLKSEELGTAFADYWLLSGTGSVLSPSDAHARSAGMQDSQGDEVEGIAIPSDGDMPPDGVRPDSAQITSEEATAPTSPKDRYNQTISQIESTHRIDMIRSLHALSKTLFQFYALVSHLEIRFIGASLLIVHEGDPSRLREAWRLVDQGASRGDGLDDDDSLVEEDGFSDIEPEGVDDEYRVDGQGRSGKSHKKRKSFFAQIFGGFGAERNDGSQGFGLLDGSPPASPRPRQRSLSRSHITTDIPDTPDGIVQKGAGGDGHDDGDGDGDDNYDSDSDEERIPDDDAKDRIPRPFTVRLIDFAHTRLADGEGPDAGFLQGVRTVMELVQGRIRELKLEQEVVTR